MFFFIVGFCRALKMLIVANLWEELKCWIFIWKQNTSYFFPSIRSSGNYFALEHILRKAPVEPKGKSLNRTFSSCRILSSLFLLCRSEKSWGNSPDSLGWAKSRSWSFNFASLFLCLALVPFLGGMNFPFLK